jgi:hypothetical protein
VSDLLIAPSTASTDRAAASRAAAAATVWRWREKESGPDRSLAAAAARKKGALGGLIGLTVAGALSFWRPNLAIVVAAIAVLTMLLALVSPLGGFRRFTALLDAFAHGVGVAVTWLLMTVAYYLLFLPVGLLLRAAGKLGITRHGDVRLASYWREAKPPAGGLDAYRKPF